MEKLFMSSDLPAAALGQDVSQAPVHAEQQGWCSHPNTPDGRAESTGHCNSSKTGFCELSQAVQPGSEESVIKIVAVSQTRGKKTTFDRLP